MQTIFPVAEMVGGLHRAFGEYRKKFSNPVIETVFANTEIPESHCLTIVLSMVDDAMNKYQLWVPKRRGPTGVQTTAALRRTFPHWGAYTYEVLSGNIYVDVLRDCQGDVLAWVELTMQEPSWHVWTLRTIGDDVILERGEDYRVQEWTRRMESGEWTDPVYDAFKRNRDDVPVEPIDADALDVVRETLRKGSIVRPGTPVPTQTPGRSSVSLPNGMTIVFDPATAIEEPGSETECATGLPDTVQTHLRLGDLAGADIITLPAVRTVRQLRKG